jgi:hypothetical protein
MKKIMSLMLGLSLFLGATAFAFAKDDTTTKSTKATKAKKTKATKAAKTTA